MSKWVYVIISDSDELSHIKVVLETTEFDTGGVVDMEEIHRQFQSFQNLPEKRSKFSAIHI